MKLSHDSKKRQKHFLSMSSIRIIGLFVSIALIFVGIIILVNYWEHRGQKNKEPIPTEKTTDEILYEGIKYLPKKGLETTIVLGIDRSDELIEGDTTEGGEINRHQQSDLILLIVADTQNKTYHVIHVNRDTMALVSVLDKDGNLLRKETMQITLAHSYGDKEETRANNVKEAVSALFENITINHYVSLSMDAVPILNDLVGGVTLVPIDTINDEIVEGKQVTLKGENALLYVRARSSLQDSTNLRRMERQKQYVNEFKNKFSSISEKDDSFVLNSLLEINDYMISDCTIERLSQLMKTISSFEMIDYLTIDGEVRKGGTYIEYYPDRDKLLEMTLDIFFEKAD